MAGANSTRACAHCGDKFEVVRRRGRPHSLCETCRKISYYKRSGRYIHVTYPLKPCEWCGQEFRPQRSHTRFCGLKCIRAHSDYRTRDKPRPRPQRLVACHGCGITTMRSMRLDEAGRYCSRECDIASMQRVAEEKAALERIGGKDPSPSGRRLHRIRSRPRDKINPSKVFARDSWKCQLCRRTLKPSDRGTVKPVAPELDHIIPIAAGGSHTWGNVQLACRECNQRKRAKALGQLLMPWAV